MWSRICIRLLHQRGLEVGIPTSLLVNVRGVILQQELKDRFIVWFWFSTIEDLDGLEGLDVLICKIMAGLR